MTFVGTGFIDPKDYPFKKWIDECKHLDCDEHRHEIKPIKVHIADMVGEEHRYCDKSQLCPEGKFRRPKKLMEAERKGFKSVMEMDMTDQASQKKAEEDKKIKEQEGLKQQNIDLKQQLDDCKQTMEARFDKLATMLQALGTTK